MAVADCSYQFRIALLGDAAVGKTSLLRCYVAGARGAAEPDPEPTVGVEFYSRTLQLPSGLRVKLQLWDTAGQERFRCGGKRVKSVTWGGPCLTGANCRGSSKAPWSLPCQALPTQSFILQTPQSGPSPQPQLRLSLSHIPIPKALTQP